MSTRAWSSAVLCKLADYADGEKPHTNASEIVVAQTEIKNSKGELQQLSFGQIAQRVLLERSDWIIKIARRSKTQSKTGTRIAISVLFQFSEKHCFLILMDGAAMPRHMDKADLVVKIDYLVSVKKFKSVAEQPLDHGKINHGTCGKLLLRTR